MQQEYMISRNLRASRENVRIFIIKQIQFFLFLFLSFLSAKFFYFESSLEIPDFKTLLSAHGVYISVSVGW